MLYCKLNAAEILQFVIQALIAILDFCEKDLLWPGQHRCMWMGTISLFAALQAFNALINSFAS